MVNLELDSSWGNQGRPERGGVERRVVWYDTKSQDWTSSMQAWRASPTPYPQHAIEGIYRPASEP